MLQYYKKRPTIPDSSPLFYIIFTPKPHGKDDLEKIHPHQRDKSPTLCLYLWNNGITLLGIKRYFTMNKAMLY